MENKVSAFFKWKKSGKVSIEDLNEDNKYVSKWEKRDVLYSVIGIYQIGIFVFHPELCKKTDCTIKSPNGKAFMGLKYLTENVNGKARFEQYGTLNEVFENSKILKIIDSVGNVIPIWPGGNVDRGTRAGCFDIPDIYFHKKYNDWFEMLSKKYPEAHLECLGSEYSYGTKEFLKMMNRDTYVAFLKHARDIIDQRKKLLEN